MEQKHLQILKQSIESQELIWLEEHEALCERVLSSPLASAALSFIMKRSQFHVRGLAKVLASKGLLAGDVFNCQPLYRWLRLLSDASLLIRVKPRYDPRVFYRVNPEYQRLAERLKSIIEAKWLY